MTDAIIVAILLVITAAIVWYIIKAKKSGQKCIGCPASKSCGGKCASCKQDENK